MSILTIILILLAIGVGLWLINSYIPMDAKIKKILNIAVVVVTIAWLLEVVGVWAAIKHATI